MKITFLIGNGFDINLGLKTKYSDFVDYYTGRESSNRNIEEFKTRMAHDKERWSDAELALGDETRHFKKGEAELFTECQVDFISELSEYLKQQEEPIDWDKSTTSIRSAFSNLIDSLLSLSEGEKVAVNAEIERHSGETFQLNIISFNYTYTLDKCVEIVNAEESWGEHKHASETVPNTFGQLIHVHGTEDENIVMGVCNESQIAAPDLFDDYELNKTMLIKTKAIEKYQNNMYRIGESIIAGSDLICVFGMSFGVTDNDWWGLVIRAMRTNPLMRLLIYAYDMPKRDPIPYRFHRYSDDLKNDLISRDSILPKAQSDAHVFQRIHLLRDNPFKELKGIAAMGMTDKNATKEHD